MLGRIRAPLMRGVRAGHVFGKFPVAGRLPITVRCFSAIPGDSAKITTTTTTLSNSVDSVVNSDTAVDIAATVTAVAPEKMNMISAALMQGIEHIHLYMGLPYWESIVAMTVLMRVVLFPVALKTVQSSARLAAMRPEMMRITELMNNDPNKNDPNVMKNYQAEMKGVMVKHKTNPIRAMLWPFSQLPVFIGFFLGLRQIHEHYPDVCSGGAYWFTDLSVADPTYILPVLNALTFLAVIEIGADGIQTSQAGQFKWVMRGVSVAMIPMTASMPASIFMYWLPNSVLSIAQTAVLKRESVRKFFDIPKPPVEPKTEFSNPLSKITEAIKSEKSQGLGAKAEILSATSDASATVKPTIAAPVGPPPVTFSAPPKKKAVK